MMKYLKNIPQDKLLHFIGGAMLFIILNFFFSLLVSFSAVAVVAIGKEGYDWFVGRKKGYDWFDWYDVVATMAGVILGIIAKL